MATAVAMPKLGMTMEEGLVVEWPVGVGQRVAQGAPLLIIESEKAEVEVEAPASGVLRHIYVGPGEAVPCGTLLAAITEDGDAPFDAGEFAAAYEPPVGFATAAPAAPAGTDPVPPPPAAPVRARADDRTLATPSARALARRLGVDITRVEGTGPQGRIVRADVGAWAQGRRGRLRTAADGVSLDVPVQGDGDAVLLLPGFGCDVSVFARQIAVLAKSHRVLGVNPRGVAGSDAPDAEVYSIDGAARDVAALLAEPVHVVGASLGAAVAIELALAAPEKVRSLALLTPFIEVSPHLDALCTSWTGLAGAVPPLALAQALIPWLFSRTAFGDPGMLRRTKRGLAIALARVPAESLLRWSVGLRRWSGTRAGDLGRIAAPTLVVAAGGDLLTPDSAAVAVAIPGARCVTVPGAGHAVAIEAADVVTDAIAAHLAAVERGDRP